MSNFISKKWDDELGEIHFYRSQRAKRMNVRIYPEYLRVALPKAYNEAEGLKFIDDIREKLKLSMAKLKRSNQLIVDEEHPLYTHSFVVKIKKLRRETIHSRLVDGVLTIEYPDTIESTDSQTQQYFWNSIKHFLRREAKRILPPLTVELAAKHGFTITDVKIQASKTRWGSCSSNKSINLSFFLLLVPFHLIEYVILHELCHTVEMNHGPRFWALMDKVTDEKSDELKRELKGYTMPKH